MSSFYSHKHTGKLYAVKISNRDGLGHEGMRDDEIQILIKFGQHPNIITVKVWNRVYNYIVYKDRFERGFNITNL